MSPTSKRLLHSQGLSPKRWFSQNFLDDPRIAEKIVSRAGLSPQDTVLEIGSGLGALTVALARTAGTVYAVEKDRDMLPLLETALARSSGVTILAEDILSVDLAQIAAREGTELIVFGNLPYQLSTPILFYLIRYRKNIRRAVLMLQKELAQRMCAPPGGKDYGRITVMLGYFAAIRPLLLVGASCFYPRPKVDSQVVEVEFKPVISSPALDEAFFSKIVKAAFSKRRKTLKNALAASGLMPGRRDWPAVLKTAGIDPVRRAETVSVEEFVRLSNAASADAPV